MSLNTTEFKCQDCKHTWPYTKKNPKQAFPGKGKLKCPNCDSKNTHRNWSGRPTIIYGDGFLKW